MSKNKVAPRFPGQHDDEEVELVFRQHPVVLRHKLIWGMLIILVGCLPLLAWPESQLAWRIFLFSPLVMLAYMFYYWIGWYYSVYIVTPLRIVEIRQKGFFNRRVTEFSMDKIHNVNYHIRGLQATLLQFGDITAQSYVGDMKMRFVPKPVQVHEQLLAVVRRSGSSSTPPSL